MLIVNFCFTVAKAQFHCLSKPGYLIIYAKENLIQLQEISHTFGLFKYQVQFKLDSVNFVGCVFYMDFALFVLL